MILSNYLSPCSFKDEDWWWNSLDAVKVLQRAAPSGSLASWVTHILSVLNSGYSPFNGWQMCLYLIKAEKTNPGQRSPLSEILWTMENCTKFNFWSSGHRDISVLVCRSCKILSPIPMWFFSPTPSCSPTPAGCPATQFSHCLPGDNIRVPLLRS